MVLPLSRALRRLILIGAFALCSVLLAYGLILSSQASAFFGAVFLAIVVVLIILDAGARPARESAADRDRERD